MRIDLTLLSADGTARDVAVLTPGPTRWGEVAPLVDVLLPAGAAAWIGRDRLHTDLLVGAAPLVCGAVVTTTRVPGRRNGPRLAVVGGLSGGREVTLGIGALLAGRDERCALLLPDPRVSRRHAEFSADSAQFVVRDLGSTHGTEVDGRPVFGPTVVAPGALVRVGDTFLARAGEVDRPPTATEVVVVAPTPAHLGVRPRVQVLGALAPAAAGAVMAIALQSSMFLLLAVLTPITVLAGAGGERWHWRQTRRRTRARASRELAVFDRKLAQAIADDAVARRAADPDPATLMRIAWQRSDRLWERARDGPRGVRVRVGLADLPTWVSVDRGGRSERAGHCSVVPVCVDLGGPSVASVAVVAPQPVRDAVARAMIVTLATLYPPTDVELAVLSADPERWSWMRWLPHWHGVAGASDLARQVRVPRAQLVVVVDGDAADPGQVTVEAGAATILLSAAVTPRTQRAARQILAAGDAGALGRVEGTSTSGGPIEQVVLDGVDLDTADAFARSLAPLRTRPGAAIDLPADCALVDLLRLDLQDLVDDIRGRWSGSDDHVHTVLGQTTQANTITVDLAADGPHLLVAGTTGSGKSELLQSLVVGLAAQFPPSRVTFLLIDYKGGAAFASCTALPHTVAVVTDLDDHQTTRVLASLNTEILRRERVLANACVTDLDALATSDEPLARLVIVVDEFATLVDELPGFVSGLVAVAQRGRSLGLHLVLSTQRPAGVVSPEIRANTALRICLRVTDPADSTDVLGSPEAATISRRHPGRGYLRRGGELVAFQVARIASARRTGRTTTPQVIELDSWRRLPPEQVDDSATDLQCVVRAIVEAGADLPPPRRPWVDALPAVLPLADIEHTSGGTVAIGLVDRPREQRRANLTIAHGETVLVAGRPRSGRTTALQTVATAFAAQHSPADLHVHAIDGVGDELRALLALPHAGTIACVVDGFDLVARLVDRLGAQLTARRAAQHVEPAQLLLLVDGWEQLCAASETYDGGRTAEALVALLGDAPAAGTTVVVTGGRSTLGARLSAQVATRLLLTLPDPTDYLLAGIDRAAVPPALPGRGVRTVEGDEFQIALPHNDIRSWDAPPTAAIRLRALPHRVTLATLHAPAAGLVLGVGGDGADVVGIDMLAGARRMLIAGPPRSGRSTALRTLLVGAVAAAMPVVVAAPPRSPLAAAAAALGVPFVDGGEAPHLPDDALVLVDDAELLADLPLASGISAWADRDPPGALVVGARSDLLAVTFRGLAADVRSARCGVLLQPTPNDGDLLGVDLPRVRAARIPGRGVLVPDQRWHLGSAPVPVQIAIPP